MSDTKGSPCNNAAPGRIRVFGAIYGLWIVGFGAVSFLAGGENVSLRTAWFAIIMPIMVLHVLLPPAPLRVSGSMLAIVLPILYLIAMALSLIPVLRSAADLAAVPVVGVVFIAALLVVRTGGVMLFLSICRWTAVSGAVLLLVVITTGNYEWGRLFGNDQPNSWARIAMVVAFCSLALPSRLLAAAVWGVALATLYVAQSRGTLLATLVSLLLMVLAFDLRRMTLYRVGCSCLAGALGLGLLLGVALLADDTVGEFTRKAEEQILRTGDRHRGSSTDFSGRGEVWGITLEMWEERPWLGFGYRRHEEELMRRVGNPSRERSWSAHNAYLATMADMGIIGLSAYAAILGIALWRSFQDFGRGPETRIVLLTLSSFAVVGLFERISINSGNPPSLMFMFSIICALEWGKRRAPVELVNHEPNPSLLANANTLVH